MMKDAAPVDDIDVAGSDQGPVNAERSDAEANTVDSDKSESIDAGFQDDQVAAEDESDVDGVTADAVTDSADGEFVESSVQEEPSEADVILALREELAAALAAKDAAVDRMQRTVADYQNSRRRQERQLADAIDRANRSLILSLLPVLDDLDLAFQNVPQPLESDDMEDGQIERQAWIDGLQQIQKKLLNVLEEQGVSRIEASGKFDPSLHEAVLSEPSDDVESGHIVGVLRAGYAFKGQVLRPAMVRVAA